MKRTLLSTAILGISLLVPSQANAAVFNSIYAFGDSLTDTGNVYSYSGGAFPPSSPFGQYSQGRFSNGNIWIEYLQERLGIPLFDFAYGGATTGSANTLIDLIPGLPGLQQEINTFIANTSVDPNALYVVWAGANDYLPTDSVSFVPYNTPDIPLTNINTAVENLVNNGAKNIMVVNLPDLGKLPRTNQLNADGICPPNINAALDSDCLNQLTAAHNAGLSTLFTSLSPDVKLFQVDVNSIFNQILANPTQFNFTNVTDACYDFPSPSCANSDQYFFWDSQHPTTAGHRIVGQIAFSALGIPEPSAIVGLTALGILAFATKLRRNKLISK